MSLHIQRKTLVACCMAALMSPPALAQVATINLTPVTLDFSKVSAELPIVSNIGQLTLYGVEYRNTSDNDASGTPSSGDVALIDGVFTITALIAGGKNVSPRGMNIDWEMTGTYVGLQDNIISLMDGNVNYTTDTQVGILTVYVSTDMTNRGSTETGLGYDDGTMVAQFTVHQSKGVYRIVPSFDGSRDLLMLKQGGLAGFFSPEITGATFDSNLDADPDADGVAGNFPIPSAWPYPNDGVNYPLRFFAEVDGSRRFGNLVDQGTCRMTGGSVDENGNILIGTPASGTDNRYQTGGQIGAPTLALPGPFGEWTHHQQTGDDGKFTFHSGTASAPVGTKILSVTCSEPGYCQPARPAPFKRIAWEGIGSFKNIDSDTLRAACPDLNTNTPSLHYYRALVEDIGEPGAGGVQLKKASCNRTIGDPITPNDCKSCPDAYQIEIHCGMTPESDVIYTVGGYIDGGNFQIHPAVGESQPTSTTKGGGKK